MRENEASIRGRVVRDLIAHTTNDLLIGKKIKNGELRKQIGTAEPPWKCPECFTMQTIEMEHFTMELLESKENANRDKIILQLHGGGYVGAMRNAYRMFAGLYNEVSHGMSVLTPDYRVAPEHPIRRRSRMPCARMNGYLRRDGFRSRSLWREIRRAADLRWHSATI